MSSSIADRFDAPRELTDKEVDFIDDLSSSCRSIAAYFDRVMPDGRQKSLAATALEEFTFWIEKAVATTGIREDEVG